MSAAVEVVEVAVVELVAVIVSGASVVVMAAVAARAEVAGGAGGGVVVVVGAAAVAVAVAADTIAWAGQLDPSVFVETAAGVVGFEAVVVWWKPMMQPAVVGRPLMHYCSPHHPLIDLWRGNWL